ncbi:MAG TPA: DHH family phosphoesterase [Pirellulales bacterium]|jgi:phosphoesterase RecJ-like protein|nr:DHH family phosphoesterase [Pirellulales bacterium]
MSIDWPRFTELVKSHDRFLLTSHIRPDCDALGSELGMAGVLEAMGKSVQIVNAQQTPPNLHFIDPGNKLKTLGVDVHAHDLDGCEVLMVLDTSAWAQLGTMAEIVRATKAHKLILDHHVGEDDMGAELFKNPQAEATGRLVLEAAHHLGVRVTSDMARPLFAAIATDTGWFRFGSTTPVTLRAAAELIDAGAVPSQIFASLYEHDSLPRLQLRGRILSHTKSDLDGRLVSTHALKEDFDATGALASDTEDVINLTLAVAGTEVAVIFVEQPTGGFKLSFRSRTAKFDCNEMAKTFGGGGHKAAAGALVTIPWPLAETKVLDAVRKAMQ